MPFLQRKTMMFHSCPIPFPLLSLTVHFLFLSPVSSSAAQNARTFEDLDPIMDPVEMDVLFKIMETLSSDQQWRASYPNPCQPGSSWPGIECRVAGNDHLFHVTRLDFGTPPNPACKKTATFPPEIFQLPKLESIFIFQCFTDTSTWISFPPNKSSVPPPLKQLSLRANPALVGAVPPQLSSLKSLQILTFSQNGLSGQIPSEIFDLFSLSRLDFSYNLLNGTIPFRIGNLTNLVSLDLSSNNFSGPIPREIGELGNLQKLDLSSNSLSGILPDSISKLGFLVFLDLSSNKLRGSLPKGLTGLQNLQYFLMEDNPMFVPLPPEISNLKKLQELRLGNSGYSGTIPASYSDLSNLSTLSLQNNRLSGEIPVGFGNLSHIYHLNLSRNFLDGVVPFNSTFLERLGRNLDLSGNPGLCLNPTALSDVHVGVDVCGNNGTGTFAEPIKKSAAPKNPMILFSVSAALVFLAFDECFGRIFFAMN